MGDPPVNPLLLTQKGSDSSVQVVLHPLPILEISDYITRSYQRGHSGVIVGALLGQQTGRETTQITIEHSFSCKAIKNEDGRYTLDFQWFRDRLDQMLLVHKEPQLDLVGWYTLVPKTGPTPDHLPIHIQILECSNESALLLGFHIEDVLHPSAGNTLPLTIYESSVESEDNSGEDKEMKDSGHGSRRSLRFRPVSFSTETGDAEMIAMQFIRQGGANAAVEDSTITSDGSKGRPHGQRGAAGEKTAAKPDTKGKQPATSQGAAAKEEGASQASKGASLSKEESELIAALQAKANAIKMMSSRLKLVISYLERLPPEPFTNAPPGQAVTASHNILRQIQALATNLELVTPAQQDALQNEMLQQSNDVTLIALVNDLLTSVAEVREVGKKFAVVEATRVQKMRRGFHDPIAGHAVSLGDVGDISL